MFQINLLILDYPNGNDLSKIFIDDSQIQYARVNFDPGEKLTYRLVDFINTHSEEYTLITSNKIIANFSPSELNNYIFRIIQNNLNGDYYFGVCYLSKWLDQCMNYNNPSELNAIGVTLVRTRGPKGYNSILVSPEGAKIIATHIPEVYDTSLNLNEYILRDIKTNKLTGVSFVSSVFNYDPLKITTPAEYVKTNECETPQPIVNDNPSNLFVIIFILICLAILVLAYVVFKIAPFVNSNLIT